MSNQNIHQNHPLIPRQQTYVLDRKIISFHSTDRDISKWPEANHFEIMLPEKLHNRTNHALYLNIHLEFHYLL